MLSQQRSVGIVAALVGYGIKFAACGFLTPVVLITFGALMFIYLTLVGPEMPFLKYVAFLLPIDGRGNATLDENDIMNAFGLVTMAFFLVSVAGRWLLRVLRRVAKRILRPENEFEAEEASLLPNQNPLTSLKRRLIVGSIAITVIYLVLFVVIPSARLAEGTSVLLMYAIFALFYAITMVAHAFYTGIDILSDVVLGWGWSRAISG
jgi:hypothetical protein